MSIISQNYDYIVGALKARDGMGCVECDTTADLTIHHIIYRSNGGSDELSNLELRCRVCHDHLHDQDPKTPKKDKGPTLADSYWIADVH